MIELRDKDEIDSGFFPIVERALKTALERNHPRELYVVKVDGWFDYKWQGFSGTEMHEIAIWRHNLTIPPFHPSRVLSERHFRSSDRGSYEPSPSKPLHIRQPSSQNLNRRVSDISSSGMFIWYSHVHKDSDRASLMLYLTESSETSGWYAGFAKKSKWCLGQVKGTSRRALAELDLA